MKMNLRQIILMFVLLLAITLGFIPGLDTAMTVHAADASGECRFNHIAWELDGTTLTISEGTSEWSKAMCSECCNGWEDYSDIIEKVVIESGVKSIGFSSFYECASLKEVIIPRSVTEIGAYAFQYCTSLTEITLPVSIESIGEDAFSYCTNLTRIEIPHDVTDIADWAFYSCTKLTNVTLPEDLKSIGTYAFANCSSLTSIQIPNSVTDIGGGAFSGCSSLTNITIPAGVTSLEGYVFKECSSLTEITIPKGVISIGEAAFSNCSELTEITIPKGVTSIEDSVFSDCKKLEKITILGNITNIGDKAFYHCEKLEEITIPNGVTGIGERAFAGCYGLLEITIPNSVTSIGDSAFSTCDSLRKVKLSENITSIGNNTFYSCFDLEEVTIPNGVTSIGKMAFYQCDFVTLIIPDSVTSIAENSFTAAIDEAVTVPCRFKANANDLFYHGLTITYTHPAETCAANDTTDTLTATCACGENTYITTLKAPTKTAYTGKAIVATCTNNIPGFTPAIKYSGNNLVNGKPVVPGTYTATLSYNSTTSVSVKYTIASPAAPAKPHKITNVVSGVHVYWPAATGASKYGLWRSENGANGTYKLITSTTATHYTDTKVESGKAYYYKITTIDTANNVHSKKSASIGITYVGTPDITLRVNRAVGIGLGWNKISGATGYAIYRKPYSGNSDWVRVATITDPNTLKWDDTSVKTANGTVYRYTIRALAGSNRKTLSGCRTTGRTMVRLTSRELNSATKAGATSIKCNWSTTAQATGYEVRFMVGDTVYKTYTIGNYKTGTKTFKDLKAGQTYKIQVRTYKKVDGVGSFYSAWSEAKYVKL